MKICTLRNEQAVLCEMEICTLRNGNLYFAKWKAVLCNEPSKTQNWQWKTQTSKLEFLTRCWIFLQLDAGHAKQGKKCIRIINTFFHCTLPSRNIGSLSTRVFETRTATGREQFAFLDRIVFQIFILSISNGEKILSNVNVVVWGQVKSEKSSLPVALRVSTKRSRASFWIIRVVLVAWRYKIYVIIA